MPRPLLALLLPLVLAGPAWTAQAAIDDPVLGDCLAVLRVNDLLWLERQAAGYAAAAGIDPSGTRGQVAQWLFRARGLEGIDLNRPALVAWRTGNAPLLAIIPLLDRPAFIAGFGQSARFGPPLIRVNERDGTTVFSQNTPRGLVEYRLLVQNDTAYLAPTVDECRRLAEHPLVRTGQHAPLELVCKPGFLVMKGDSWPEPTMPGLPFDVDPHLVAMLGRFGEVARDDVLAQIASISLQARPLGDIGVVIEGRIQARADSALAQVIALQKNQGSRLLPILRGPNTVMSLHGSIAWQGQLDRIGQQMTGAVQAALGERWTAGIEDAWRESWAARDHNGAFAVTWDVLPRPAPAAAPAPPKGTPAKAPAPLADLAVNLAVEQAQAGEQVVRTRQLAEALVPLFDAGIPESRLVHAFTETSVSGLSGFRHLITGTVKGRPVEVDHVLLATGHHLVGVQASDGSAGRRIADLVPKLLLEATQKPDGTAALFSFRYDPAIEARLLFGERIGRLDPAPVEIWAKSTPQGDLLVHFELPLIPLAVVERESRSVSLQKPDQDQDERR
jgi:hypothetical protein